MSNPSFANLRVYVEKESHYIYTELTRGSSDEALDVPFSIMPHLFVAAACVGAKENAYKELKKKRDIFVADALDGETQIPVLLALAYKNTGDLKVLSDPKKILEIAQAYANGGIEILYEQLKIGEGLRPLFRLVDFILQEKTP
jgi:hypothetical protein